MYTQQALDQLIDEKMLALEADRMGLRVTDEEHADLLKKLVPTAFTGDTFIGMDRYTAEVQARFQMSVPEFESEVKKRTAAAEIPATGDRRHHAPAMTKCVMSSAARMKRSSSITC